MTTPSTIAPLPDDLTHHRTGPGGSAEPVVDGMLWLAFHRAVTVQPPDLRRWLDRQERTARATGRVDQLALGRQVADLLETQRCDLTSADIRTMRAVLTRIRALRAVALTCAPEHAEDVRWHLLALGHDLKRAER